MLFALDIYQGSSSLDETVKNDMWRLLLVAIAAASALGDVTVKKARMITSTKQAQLSRENYVIVVPNCCNRKHPLQAPPKTQQSARLSAS